MNAKNSIAESIAASLTESLADSVATMRLTALGLALASSFLLIPDANAAGLGKLTVLSALGQPLRAEIELTAVSKDDAGNLVTKLASPEAYRQANVALSSTLSSLSFSVETRGARQVVVVTSAQSVNEPFLEILVELNSSGGKLVREYTMLLDPAEMQANNGPLSSSNGKTISRTNSVITQQYVPAAPVAPVAPVATTTRQRPAAQSAANNESTRQNSEPTLVPAPERKAPMPTAPNATEKTGTAPGADPATAGKSTSYRIKSGDTLTKIADQYKPAGVSMEQMLVALQRENSAAFIDNNMNLLRSGRILTIPNASQAEQTQPAEAQKIVLAQAADFTAYRNRLAGQVQQSAAAPAPAAKNADSGKITAKVTETPTALTESKDKLKLSKAQLQEQADKKAQEEDRIAKQRALDEANARVKELEANTAKLKNILDLKNQATAKAEAKKSSDANAAPAVSNSQASASQPKSSTPPTAAQAAPKLPVSPPVAAPAPQPGLMDQVMQYLPIGAGVLALLGLVGLWSNRRKKKTEHFEDESILTGSSIKTNSLFGSTGGQSVDTNNSVFNSNFAPSASQLDANEVDPVAEADVYIAYGRDEQAEEILREALRTQPDRQAVRVKLLEIYAHRKDVRTFENIASELYGMTGGQGPEWHQAAALGAMIDPMNPLYAGGQDLNHPATLGASTLPVESLDPESLLGNSLSQDMLDSISAKKDAAPSMLMDEFGQHDNNEISDGLDFDLGLTTHPEPEIESHVAPPGSAADQEIPYHAPSLAQEPAAHQVDEVMHAESLPTLTAAEDLSASFDLDQYNTKAPETSAQHSMAANAQPEETTGSIDFADLDFDFDIPKAKSDSMASVNEASVTGSSGAQENKPDMLASNYEPPRSAKPVDFDLGSLNFDLPKAAPPELPAAPTAVPNPSPNIEAIPPVMEAIPPAPAASAPIAAAPSPLSGLSMELEDNSEFSAEMATKLDLALAYQEIGDRDGARELLEEVRKGGSREQKNRAETMIQELV